MLITKKTIYAIRACLELAKRFKEGPVKIGLIAKERDIPHRFLEIILHKLRGRRLLKSVRGSNGLR